MYFLPEPKATSNNIWNSNVPHKGYLNNYNEKRAMVLKTETNVCLNCDDLGGHTGSRISFAIPSEVEQSIFCDW